MLKTTLKQRKKRKNSLFFVAVDLIASVTSNRQKNLGRELSTSETLTAQENISELHLQFNDI